jgi:glycosyltransferase involved in cell wall biosynthesis
LIPVYNTEEQTLKQCIASVQAQAETINQAAEVASGEFIGVLDHDDELAED